MTSINQDTPVTASSVTNNGPVFSQRGPRRRRSLRRSVKRKAQQFLQLGNLLRMGAISLVLLTFLHITFKNDVLNPSATPASPSVTAGIDAAADQNLVEMRTASSEMYVRDEPTVASRYAIASWVTDSLDKVSRASVNLAVNTETTLGALEPDTSELTLTDSETFVVNEGGSLWRTGKRFISDEVLLDKLIDSLSDNGVDVGSVKAGQEILVNELDNQDLQVIMEIGDDSFESRISENSVVTTTRDTKASDLN